jgi:hypothetical protein
MKKSFVERLRAVITEVLGTKTLVNGYRVGQYKRPPSNRKERRVHRAKKL